MQSHITWLKLLVVMAISLCGVTHISAFAKTAQHEDSRIATESSNPDTIIQYNIYELEHPKHEIRAVWLTTISGIDWPRTLAKNESGIKKQKQELTSILDKLKKANINTVLLQTRIRGSVIYPSDIEPWDECLTGKAGRHPGYDPLAFAIEECHKRGMELHAWIVSIPLGKVSKQRAFGKNSVTRKNPELCKTAKGEYFMIPGEPGTAEYIASICHEIASKYDIDGISLDYIRYPEKLYRFSDDNLYKKYGKGKYASIADWKRANITKIVEAVSSRVKAIKPWVKLSSSPIGKYGDLSRYSSQGWNCFDAVYQDPQAWLRTGVQDMLFPMMYFLGDHFYPFLFDWREQSCGHPVIPGLGIYFLDPREGKWTLNDVRGQMHTARNSKTGGMALYRSDYFTRNLKGIYDAATEEFFPYPALQPPMSWANDTMPPLPPSNLRYHEGMLFWNHPEGAETQNDNGEYIFFNIYGSNSYPVDTGKPENILATRVRGTNAVLSGRSSAMRFFAVTASDRFGNESQAAQEDESMNRPAVNRALNPLMRVGTSGIEIGEYKFTTEPFVPSSRTKAFEKALKRRNK